MTFPVACSTGLAREGWSGRDDFTTYEEEIAYVKAWISERCN
ncbi:hypothetical protein WMF31_11145 [Sorangium sp. So ce1036]